MSEPFVGEIRMFGGNFAPAGWAFCAGQLMAIAQNDTLFNLIGTTYGGDGQETFGIPDLQGRVPLHAGQGPGISQNYQLGELAGVETVTLSANQMPQHNHAFIASTDNATTGDPSGRILATSGQIKSYTPFPPTANTLNANAVGMVGGNQPHDNMGPYLVITFIISLFGFFPSQT